MRYVEVPDGPKLSKIGLGTWQFGSREWGYGKDYESRAGDLITRALDLGVTLIDTAEVYGMGRSERLVGEALGDNRDRAVIATKIFPVLPLAAVVQQRAVASAARLGVEVIDLYQVHQPNPVIRDGATMKGMRALQQIGLVREVGVSNYSLDRWQAAEAELGGRVLSDQVRYSLVSRGPDTDLIPYAQANDRIVIAYSPLAQGLLSGKYDADHRPRGAVRAGNPLFLPENLERATPLLRTLREVARTHDASPAQIALAWTVRHRQVVAIPGASGVEQLESNAAAADIELTEDEITALTDAAERFEPITGAAALPRLVRSRFRARTG